MINRRELVLIIALAFSLGAIFADFTNPKAIVADTSNTVYQGLDSKINQLASRVNGLQSQINSLKNQEDSNDPRVSSLIQTVKDLASVQKTILRDMASEKDLNALTKRVSLLEGPSQKSNSAGASSKTPAVKK